MSVWRLDQTQNLPYQQQALEIVAETLNQASSLLPGGVYTTFRTFPGKRILPLDDHIQRLEHSAALEGKEIEIDEAALRSGLRRTLQDSIAECAWVRISVDLEQAPGTVYIITAPLILPAASEYEHGARAVTLALERENPQSKRTAFIAIADRLRKRLPEDVNEGLIVDKAGRILEGLSSNFYGVLDGVIWTAGEDILPGITREIVLQIAAQAGIPLQLEAVRINQVAALDEAFITSSSRSVLPLRQIDSSVIGRGEPGSLTRTVMRSYLVAIQSRLKPM